ELERIDNAIKALSEVLRAPIGGGEYAFTPTPSENAKQANAETYVDLAVRAIEKYGRALPIMKIVGFVREAKRNPGLSRNTIESTIVRHIKLQKAEARVVKVGRGTYSIPHRSKEPLLLEEPKT